MSQNEEESLLAENNALTVLDSTPVDEDKEASLLDTNQENTNQATDTESTSVEVSQITFQLAQSPAPVEPTPKSKSKHSAKNSHSDAKQMNVSDFKTFKLFFVACLLPSCFSLETCF